MSARAGHRKKSLLCLFILLNGFLLQAQFNVTIPWSTSLNMTFESYGITGNPLPAGMTDFTFSRNARPDPGFYSFVQSNNDGGHLYFGPFPMTLPATGNKMVVGYNSTYTPKDIFRDTVRSLCGNSKYLFWAGINNANPGTCLTPSLTMSVETLTGMVIGSFQTGGIGGALAQDHYAWYPGFFNPIKRPAVPFYGFYFQLPAGVTDVIVRITTNAINLNPQCSTILELDNILVSPAGPDLKISSPVYPGGGWTVGACFQGSPLKLNTSIADNYQIFGTPDFATAAYTNPGFQWQQSLDQGYTWTDIPGENSINISHQFNIPDTFWVRLRASELQNIGNPNCSNVSNIIKVEVDGLPKDFDLSTNSPVCTDGDVYLKVTGGVTYNTFGPNGFYDNSPFPHIYHPALRDSGWYYSEIMSFGGCKGVDSEYVRIIGPDLKLSAGRAICYNDTLHLHASGGDLYSWTPETGLNNAHIADPVAQPLEPVTYEVRVTDQSGCSAYGKVVIPLRNVFLKADFTAPAVACPGDVISYRDTSEGQIRAWNWDLGNGTASNIKVPPAITFPLLNGIYVPVSLSVTDTSGCVQTKKKYIRVVNNCYIAVPTAFTPNQDGLNDYLYPLNAYKATNLDFRIFNRNGQMVFHTNDWTRKWDGNIGGLPQAPGVYVWILRYTDEHGKPVYQQGTSTLIR